MTLDQAFDPRANALNALRLILAVVVLAVHSWHLTGAVEPHLGALRAHELAVDGFFVLSGFLLLESVRRADSVLRFLWHRAVRLLPGYYMCMVITVSVFGPIASVQSGISISEYMVDTRGPLAYLSSNAGLAQRQYDLGGGWLENPVAGIVNGSLWSLYFEAKCYIALAVFAAAGLVGGRRVLPATAAAACLMWLLLAVAPDALLPRLGLMFAIGAALRAHAKDVPLNRALALICTIALVLSAYLPAYQLIGALPLGYLLTYAASRWPLRIGARRDLSYGLYIYAFPVQQAIVATGERRVPVVLLATLLIVTPLAWFSFTFVEAPAMRFRNWSPLASTGRPVPPVSRRRDLAGRLRCNEPDTKVWVRARAIADPASREQL